jgi:hypothetical protein
VTDPSPETLLAARHSLDEAISAADQRVVALRRTRRPRRRVITALAAAVAATAAVLAVPVLTAGPASAEAVLLAAADAAGRQPDHTEGAAYWHVVSELDYLDGVPFHREIWLGRTAETVSRTADIAAATGHAPDYTMGNGGPSVFAVGDHLLSWADLDALPTDPVELGALLRAYVAGHQSGEENALWEGVTGLLRESPASPALRRALWQVAAGMPNVELLGTMTDAAGRQGTAIARDQLDRGWFRVVYIFDPADGSMLETRDIAADGTVQYRQTTLDEEPSATAPPADPPACGPGSLSGKSC